MDIYLSLVSGHLSAVMCSLIMADAVVIDARMKIGIISVTSVGTLVSCHVLVDHG